MIKSGGFPLHLAVAGFTFAAQPTLVNIIFAVTRNTCSRRFLPGKKRCRMAGNAFHRFVLAQQLEFGCNIMIELDRLPAAFHMAGFAFLAVLPFMLVDL